MIRTLAFIMSPSTRSASTYLSIFITKRNSSSRYKASSAPLSPPLLDTFPSSTSSPHLTSPTASPTSPTSPKNATQSSQAPRLQLRSASPVDLFIGIYPRANQNELRRTMSATETNGESRHPSARVLFRGLQEPQGIPAQPFKGGLGRSSSRDLWRAVYMRVL